MPPRNIIRTGDTPSLTAEGFSAPVDSTFDEALGLWKIDIRSTPVTEKISSLLRHFGVGDKAEKGAVYTIVVPAGLAELNVKAGMGSLTVEKAETESISLSAEMGSVTAKDVRAGSGNFSADMGAITVESFHGETCRLTAGMGKVRFHGQVSDTLHVDCSMGFVQASLPRPAQYTWAAKGGSGSISVDGRWIAGVFGMQGDMPEARPHLDLKCGMGSIAVSFTDNDPAD